MNSLQLRPEDCSAFGRLILQYVQANPQHNMSQLARQVKISRAGISWVCLKRSDPSEETATKIAQIIGVDTTKIARLIHENKLENLASLSNLNYTAKLDRELVNRPIPAEDAIAGLNSIFHSFHYIIRSIPEAEKPSDFQIYKQAHDIVKAQVLKSRIIARRKPRSPQASE